MQIFSFVIIILLILNNRNDLSTNNIDRAAIVIIFLFSIGFRVRKIDTVINFNFELLFLMIAIAGLVVFLKAKIIPTQKIIVSRWFFLSIFAGILFSIVMIPIRNGFNWEVISKLNSYQSIYAIFYYIFYGIGAVGILEEPIYRGFLWGTLKNSGLNDFQSIVIQAGLFWISHMKMIQSPFSFFIIAPLISLILGLLMYKSKSIIPPLIFHIIYNAFYTVIFYRY